MRIAETAGSRTLLVISSLGLVVAAVAAAIAPSAPGPAPRARSLPMQGCVKAPAPARVEPAPRAPTLAGELQLLRNDLTRCVEGFVDATIALQLHRDGRVLALELEGNLGPRPDALRSCVTTVVHAARFPASETEMRVEMLFKQN